MLNFPINGSEKNRYSNRSRAFLRHAGLLLVLSVVASGYQHTEARAGSDQASQTTAANVRAVEKLFYQGFSGGNLEVLDEVLAPDVDLGYPGVPPGIDGAKKIVKANNDAFDEWKFTIHEMITVDDKVIVRTTGSGIHAHSFKGEKPTGKRVELNAMAIYQLVNGKIVKAWVAPDNLGFLTQLGLIESVELTGD